MCESVCENILVKILEIECVSSCRMVFALCSGEVRFTIAHTVPKLCTLWHLVNFGDKGGRLGKVRSYGGGGGGGRRRGDTLL